MKKVSAISLCTAVFFAFALTSSAAQEAKAPAQRAENQPAAAEETKGGREYSGMYSFLEDGEFVQITVEDAGKVTGFVSRYTDESDKGAFLDQYLRSGKLDGNKLSFATEMERGLWFDFKGTVGRGEGKNPGDEAYYVLKGTLTSSTSDAAKKVTSHAQEVVLKRFPAE